MIEQRDLHVSLILKVNDFRKASLASSSLLEDRASRLEFEVSSFLDSFNIRSSQPSAGLYTCLFDPNKTRWQNPIFFATPRWSCPTEYAGYPACKWGGQLSGRGAFSILKETLPLPDLWDITKVIKRYQGSFLAPKDFSPCQ